ncbi:NAD(P)-binding domain-containing protein, partial [Acidithiobacillus sp. MC6.1]|nr:NAD(P)-binding domain-containing protein [Acidithiobacillus sp. MC6.1]
MTDKQQQSIGMVGLGRMGANMARRLHQGGAQVVVYNRHGDKAEALARESGMAAAGTLEALLAALPSPRVVWLMLPAGDATQGHIDALVPRLSAGDV